MLYVGDNLMGHISTHGHVIHVSFTTWPVIGQFSLFLSPNWLIATAPRPQALNDGIPTCFVCRRIANTAINIICYTHEYFYDSQILRVLLKAILQHAWG